MCTRSLLGQVFVLRGMSISLVGQRKPDKTTRILKTHACAHFNSNAAAHQLIMVNAGLIRAK